MVWLSDDGSNLFWAQCDNEFKHFQECHLVKMARVCSASTALCEPGWTRNAVQNRCYKFFADKKTQAEAQAICEENKGSLTSIHTSVENAFIAGKMIASNDDAGSWVGLASAADTPVFKRTWMDKTPLSFYLKTTNGFAAACTVMTSNGKWTTRACDSASSFVCRKVPLGRSLSCACSGESDDSHRGGSCKKWDRSSRPNDPAWYGILTYV